jgi:hypothetical protein
LSGWLVESKAGYVVEVVSRPPGSKGYVEWHPDNAIPNRART